MNEVRVSTMLGRAPDVCFYVKCWRGFQEESFVEGEGQNKTVLGPEQVGVKRAQVLPFPSSMLLSLTIHPHPPHTQTLPWVALS